MAASRHEAIEHEETTFTAGMAYLFSLACSSRSQSACPVTTPGLTEAGSGVAFTARASAMEVAARGAVTGAMPTFRDGEAENRDSILVGDLGGAKPKKIFDLEVFFSFQRISPRDPALVHTAIRE